VVGQIELGVVPSASVTLLPTARAVLEERHPGLRIRIVNGLSGELLSRVIEGSLGAAIVTEPSSIDKQLRLETLIEERLLIICHKRHGQPSMTTLEKLPFIRFNRRNGVGRIVERELNRAKLRVHDAMEADTLDGILTMIASGYGVAVVPEHSILAHYKRSIRSASFGKPPACRKLALVISRRPDFNSIEDALLEAFGVAVKRLTGTMR